MNKRILVISPTPTHPTVSGSRVRIEMMISQMITMGYEVHFLHIEREPGDRDQMKSAWGDHYHTAPYVEPERGLFSRIRKKLKTFVNRGYHFQYEIDDWWDNSANPVLHSVQRQYDFDVVMVEYVFFSRALLCFPCSARKIIDTHDIFTDRYKLYLDKGVKPQWFSTTKKQEKKALDRADLIIAIQDEERDFLQKMTKKPVETIGHIVQLKAPQVSGESRKILYVASKNPINAQSIEWFVSEVLGGIRAAVADAELIIAGNICEIIPDYEGVTKLGLVDDLENVYDMAAVVVNPMLYGTGLKIKNVEALGFSRPLVTSPVGADGLEDIAGHAFLVAEAPDEFAAHVINLLTDSDMSDVIARRAYESACKWNDNILDSLGRLLQTPSQRVS